MTYPLLLLNDQLAPEAAIVLIMLAIEVYLLTQIVPRRGPAPTLTRLIIGSTALLGSAGLLMALSGALLTPTLGAYSVVLFMFNFMMLGPPGIWMIAIVLLRDRRIDPNSGLWPGAVAGMATFGEAMMGLLFVVAGGGPLDLIDVLAATLTSAWFLWAMGGAMLALIAWVRFEPTSRALLLALVAGAALGPFVVALPVLGAGLMSGLMVATFLGLFLARGSASAFRADRIGLARGTVAAFLAMTVAGLLVALGPDSPGPALLFGGVMATVMAAEFAYLVAQGLRGPNGPGAPVATADRGTPAPALADAGRAP